MLRTVGSSARMAAVWMLVVATCGYGENDLGVLDLRRRGWSGVGRRLFDEGGDGVGEIGDGVDEIDGADVGGEFWPGFEAVFAGKDELGIGEDEAGDANIGLGEFLEAGMMVGDANEGCGRPKAVIVEKILGLLLVLFEVWTGG